MFQDPPPFVQEIGQYSTQIHACSMYLDSEKCFTPSMTACSILGFVISLLLSCKASLDPGPSCSTSSDKQISFHSIAQIGFPNTFPLDSDLPSGERYPTFEQPEPGQGDRFSKDPETFRARRQIFKSKPLNISTIPSPQTSPNCFDN